MFLPFTISFRWPSFGRRSRASGNLKLDQVKEYDIEIDPEKSARTLKHLLKANHANYSIIYNNLRFHNHSPHILGSGYILGATSDQLTYLYEKESENHEAWKDTPGEITKDDWREFLGQKNYQRAFIDFFEDQLVAFGYDWKALLEHYLHHGDAPLINSLVSGLGHPLIHLGYAYELNSRDVAVEALSLGACFYDSLHKYIDNPAYTKPSTYSTTSVLAILHNIANDSRLDGLFKNPGGDNIDIILDGHEAVLLEHWNAFKINTADLASSLYSIQVAAAALVAATPPAAHPSSTTDSTKPAGEAAQQYYDFFLLHLLTSSHAIRILLPLLPPTYIPLTSTALVLSSTPSPAYNMLRQWLLFTLLAYIAQLRPNINLHRIEDVALDGRTWKDVKHLALTSHHRADAHYVKGCRALMVAEETWKDRGAAVQDAGGEELAENKISEQFWLKAGIKFATTFREWGGFAATTTGYKPH